MFELHVPHLVREHVCELRLVVEKRRETGGDVVVRRQRVCGRYWVGEQPERKQSFGVNRNETLADAVDVVGDELVVVEAVPQPQPIAIVNDGRTRRLGGVVVERHETVLPLDFVEVRVDFFAEVEVGLIQIERERLQLLVPALGLGPLFLGSGVVGLTGALRLGG